MSSNCRRWYFAFSDQTTNPIARICKRGFRHVLAVTELPNGTVMLIDPLASHVNVEYSSDVTLYDTLQRLQQAGFVVVFFLWTPPIGKTVRRSWGITCASVLAYMAGIPFSGVTPYQLFKRLIALRGSTL